MVAFMFHSCTLPNRFTEESGESNKTCFPVRGPDNMGTVQDKNFKKKSSRKMNKEKGWYKIPASYVDLSLNGMW